MKAMNLIALQLACVNVRWIQKIKRGFCREDMIDTRTSWRCIECPPPHGHNSRKVRVTTVASFITAIVVLLFQLFTSYWYT